MEKIKFEEAIIEIVSFDGEVMTDLNGFWSNEIGYFTEDDDFEANA